MHLCEWPHLFQDSARFLSSTANRTTANKQGAPCTQLRARECGEGAVYRPPNNIIPVSHPHPLAVYPGKSKVCANSANQGPWDESQGQPPLPGVEATANSARASCASAAVAQQHLTLHQSQTSKGWTPSPAPAELGTDQRGLIISTCCTLEVGSDQRAKARHCEKYVPRENLLRTAFQTWSVIFLFMPKSVLYNHERERETKSKREGERERESFQEERKS